MDFSDVDRRYAELNQQYVAGTLSPEEFDEQLRTMMIQDSQGRWWAKARETGDWNYYDAVGNIWVRADPPGSTSSAPPPVPPAALAASTAASTTESTGQTAGFAAAAAPQPDSTQAAAPQTAATQPMAVQPARQQPKAAQSSIYTVTPISQTGPELSSGLKVVFYILSFLIWFVGIILFFVYRNKPAAEDRAAAKVFLILGIVSIALGCICSVSGFGLIGMLASGSS